MLPTTPRWTHVCRLILFSAFGITVFSVQQVLANPSASSSTSSGESLGDPKHLTLMIVYATVALTFSFLCSVAEAVMLSISPSYIGNIRKQGKVKAADQLHRLKQNIDQSLAAILTLNTIAHTVGAGGAGAEAAAYFGDRYVGVSMAVLTLLILFLSEIIPKTVGALYWRSLAPVVGRLVQWLIWILYPLIWVSELLTKLLARGKNPHAFSRDEFTAMVDLGRQAGQLDATESRVLTNLFRFPGLCAEDIMTPRTVAFTLQQDQTVADALDSHPKIPFNRIPIYAQNRDEITGFVLKSDMLLNQAEHDGRAKLRDLKRPIQVVHERTLLTRLLEDLLNQRAHIAIVVGEHGGMQGIVTLEDVVETLIGSEIVDETDTIDDMRRLARQRWEERMQRVAGSAAERQVKDGSNPPADESTSPPHP